MDYMIGCNYWNSKEGIDMWKLWDRESVYSDLKTLRKYNIEYLRVFPTWRDFQPVVDMKGYVAIPTDTYMYGERAMKDPFELDAECCEHFKDFCGMCDELGIKLVVSIVTGWMSGMLFMPRVVENLNLITDPKALMWEGRYVKAFVGRFKDEKAIKYWDLGNECNCMATVASREQAFVWADYIRNAIKATDPSRKIMSGMHDLSPCMTYSKWTIQDQGEITDMVTTHPYISPTIDSNKWYPDDIRSIIIHTVQTQYYADVSQKPAMMQELGTLTDLTANKEQAAAIVRTHLWSGFANGSKGLLWWCGFNLGEIERPPYEWSAMEGELGIVYDNGEPKPVAYSIKKTYEDIEKIGNLPDKETDAVVITSTGLEYGREYLKAIVPAFVFAKQSGIDVRFMHFNQNLPKADMYIVPSINTVNGTGSMIKYREMIKQVEENGADLLLVLDGGGVGEFERVTGLRSSGVRNAKTGVEFDYDGEHYSFCDIRPVRLKSIGAEVLCTDSDGNVIFSKNKLGKGNVYVVSFGIERTIMENMPQALTSESDINYFKFYKKACERVLKKKICISHNKNVFLTHHKVSENEYMVTAINYSLKEQKPEIEIKDGWKAIPIIGELDTIGNNNCSVFKVVRS